MKNYRRIGLRRGSEGALRLRQMATIRILIIEDERQTVDELRDHLELFGYETEVALTAPVGVSVVEERQMDLAIVGEEVHDVSGLDVLMKLKEIAPLMKVVMMTSQRSKRYHASLIRSGAQGVITQPLDKKLSLKVIGSIVKSPLLPRKRKRRRIKIKIKKKAGTKARTKVAVKSRVKKEAVKKVTKKKVKKRTKKR